MDQFRLFCLSFLFLFLLPELVLSYRSEPAAGAVFPGSISSISGCSWHPILQESPDSKRLERSTTQLLLDCQLRKLNVDFWNYTRQTFTLEQIKATTSLRLRCHPQLFFESFLNGSSEAILGQLGNLQALDIQYCKIRKLNLGQLGAKLGLLRNVTIRTFNGEWVGGNYGLEIEPPAEGSVGGPSTIESLDLSFNNIWSSVSDRIFCPLRHSLVALNLSHNRLSEVWDESVGSLQFSGPSESGPAPGQAFMENCQLALTNLDLSYNVIRRVGRASFSRMRKLTSLALDHNYIDEIEDAAFSGFTTLLTLSLNSNRLVALPPQLFKSAGQLQDLQLQNNSLSVLSPMLFSGLSQLRRLDLSRNGLTSQWIKENIFHGLAKLVSLKLSYNQLEYVDSNLFLGLSRLASLQLDNNRIETVDPQAFASLGALATLDLSRNQLKYIESRFFWHNPLVQLYLDYNRINTIDDQAFKNCSQLSDLGLASNLLAKVPGAIQVGLPELKTLDLGENKIRALSPGAFKGLGALYGLRLAGNVLESLPGQLCQPLGNLRVLNLAQNQIQSMSESSFHGCTELRALRLDSNQLERLPSALSPGLLWLNMSQNRIHSADYHLLPNTVEWLDLSYNSLDTLGVSNPSEVSNPMSDSGFHLRVLDASHNNLTQLDSSTIPPSLETLRLNHNRLKSIAPNTFFTASRLRRVELMGNELEQLPMSALRLPPGHGAVIPDFYIGSGSILTCSCSMEWLTKLDSLPLNLRAQLPRIVDAESAFCKSQTRPASNQLIPLLEAKPEHFLCPYQSVCFALCHCCGFNCDCENLCPDSCSCFHDAGWSTNVVDCSRAGYNSIPGRIPMDATELYLDGNNLSSAVAAHTFIGKKSLRILHLNSSSIESIKNKTFNGLKALEILHLDHNLLGSLAGFEFDDLDSLRELYLNHNLLTQIAGSTFAKLRHLQVLRLDGNLLVNFDLWELSNPTLTSLQLASNPWSCDCEFIAQVQHFVSVKSAAVFVDYHLAKCEPEVDGHGHQFGHRLDISMTLSSMCNSNFIEPDSSDNSLGRGDRDEQRSISRRGDPALTNHHNSVQLVVEPKPKSESNGLVWTWILALVGFILALALITAIFRKVIHVWCRAHLPVQNLNLPYCCCSKSGHASSTEKVGCGNGSKIRSGSGTGHGHGHGSDHEKLFDAYFLYSKVDEEMLCQKLIPELEQNPNNPCSRLCLHYRDLCLNLENPWSSEMILTAADSSKRIVIVLSRSFLHSELTIPDFRSCIQHVLLKWPKKIVFILLPPLNELNFPQLYPDFKASSYRGATLDWMDKNFWTKLKGMLPVPAGGAWDGSSGNTVNRNSRRYQNNLNMQLQHEFLYNSSPPPPFALQAAETPTSDYYRNVIPYSIPNSTISSRAHLHRNSLHNVPRNSSTPLYWQGQSQGQGQGHGHGHAPSVNVIYPSAPNPALAPAAPPGQYSTFADNFRHHRQVSQEQQQQPFVFASSKKTPSGSGSPYKPLIHTPQTDANNSASVNHSNSDSSCSTNILTHSDEHSCSSSGSSSSNDERNQLYPNHEHHIYSTLDSPLTCPQQLLDSRSAGNGTMYFV